MLGITWETRLIRSLASWSCSSGGDSDIDTYDEEIKCRQMGQGSLEERLPPQVWAGKAFLGDDI